MFIEFEEKVQKGFEEFKIYPLDANLKTWNAEYLNIPFEPDENTIFFIVHNLGNIVNVPALKQKYPDSIFIEDNCEGMFGEYENKNSGTESFCSSLSFFGNKNITTGEGGAFLTNDSDLFTYINKVHGQGQTETRFVHDVLGYNYRMTNVHAAILLGQLDIYNDIKQKKLKVFNLYRELLKGIEGIHLQSEEIGYARDHMHGGPMIHREIANTMLLQYEQNQANLSSQ